MEPIIQEFLDNIDNVEKKTRQNQKRLDIYKLKKLNKDLELLEKETESYKNYSDPIINASIDETINKFKNIHKPQEVVNYDLMSIDNLKLKKMNVKEQIQIDNINSLLGRLSTNINIKTYSLDSIDQLISKLSSYNQSNENKDSKKILEYTKRLLDNKFNNFSIDQSLINNIDFYNNNCSTTLRYLKLGQTNNLEISDIINNSKKLLLQIVNDNSTANNEMLFYLKKYNIESEDVLKNNLKKFKENYEKIKCDFNRLIYLYNQFNTSGKKNFNVIFEDNCTKYNENTFPEEITGLLLKDKIYLYNLKKFYNDNQNFINNLKKILENIDEINISKRSNLNNLEKLCQYIIEFKKSYDIVTHHKLFSTEYYNGIETEEFDKLTKKFEILQGKRGSINVTNINKIIDKLIIEYIRIYPKHPKTMLDEYKSALDDLQKKIIETDRNLSEINKNNTDLLKYKLTSQLEKINKKILEYISDSATLDDVKELNSENGRIIKKIEELKTLETSLISNYNKLMKKIKITESKVITIEDVSSRIENLKEKLKSDQSKIEGETKRLKAEEEKYKIYEDYANDYGLKDKDINKNNIDNLLDKTKALLSKNPKLEKKIKRLNELKKNMNYQENLNRIGSELNEIKKVDKILKNKTDIDKLIDEYNQYVSNKNELDFIINQQSGGSNTISLIQKNKADMDSKYLELIDAQIKYNQLMMNKSSFIGTLKSYQTNFSKMINFYIHNYNFINGNRKILLKYISLPEINFYISAIEIIRKRNSKLYNFHEYSFKIINELLNKIKNNFSKSASKQNCINSSNNNSFIVYNLFPDTKIICFASIIFNSFKYILDYEFYKFNETYLDNQETISVINLGIDLEVICTSLNLDMILSIIDTIYDYNQIELLEPKQDNQVKSTNCYNNSINIEDRLREIDFTVTKKIELFVEKNNNNSFKIIFLVTDDITDDLLYDFEGYRRIIPSVTLTKKLYNVKTLLVNTFLIKDIIKENNIINV